MRVASPTLGTEVGSALVHATAWTCATGMRAVWYAFLTSPFGARVPDDGHVLACVLASAATEPCLSQATGLTAAEIDDVAIALLGFPALRGIAKRQPTPVDESEADLVAIMSEGCDIDPFGPVLARLVVRRSYLDGHLWQSMGLRDRVELSGFLHRRFPTFAAGNVHGMRWKKFLFRELCAREGAILCKSPVCTTCIDRAECFPTSA